MTFSAPTKIGEKGFALFKETPGVLRGKFLEKRAVGGDDKPAHANGVLSHGLDQQEIVNTLLNSLGVVCRRGFVQLVVRRASVVVNIGVAAAFPFPPVVALDATYGLFFELIHMQDEIGHG